MENTELEWLLIPFNEAEMLVKVRYPSSIQNTDKLKAVFEAIKEQKFNRNEIIEYLNMQEECCKATMNRPTFSELEKEIHGKDKIREKNLKTLEELRAKLELVKNDFQKQLIKKEIDELELCCGYSLPDDTMVALMNIAYGIGISDIQKLTKEKLLTAYSKARLYGGKPSDFISGLFTDGDRQDIDDYATLLGLKTDK
jgi:hypothetical protein